MKRIGTQETRFQAWGLVVQQKHSKEEAGRLLNVSSSTVKRWVAQIDSDAELMAMAKEQSMTPLVKAKSHPLKGEPKAKRNGKQWGEKSQKIVEWLQEHPNGIREQFVMQTGVQINPSWWYRVKARMRSGNGVSATKEAPTESVSKITRTTQANLVAEIEFLRWWNLGERKGWVERLLQQLQE